jgi:hypothetical protein
LLSLIIKEKKLFANLWQWRHDIQQNDTQHKDSQHNNSQNKDSQHKYSQHKDTQHKDTQHNDSQHKDTQHKRPDLLHLASNNNYNYSQTHLQAHKQWFIKNAKLKVVHKSVEAFC